VAAQARPWSCAHLSGERGVHDAAIRHNGDDFLSVWDSQRLAVSLSISPAHLCDGTGMERRRGAKQSAIDLSFVHETRSCRTRARPASCLTLRCSSCGFDGHHAQGARRQPLFPVPSSLRAGTETAWGGGGWLLLARTLQGLRQDIRPSRIVRVRAATRNNVCRSHRRAQVLKGPHALREPGRKPA